MAGLLKNKSDWRTILFVSIYFVLVSFQWFADLGSPWLQCSLLFLTCLFSWWGAVITHNCLHVSVFYNATLNKIFQVILTLTYGFPVSEYTPGHNLSHHQFTQTRKDVMRTTKVQFKSNLLNFVAFFFVVAADVTRANYKYVTLKKVEKKGWYQQLLLEASFCWGSKVLLMFIDWRKCLLYIVIPHLFAVWAITTINYFWHDGCDQDSPYNHSRNFVGKAFNWFFFNNGYHGMHHMDPGLHWSMLPKKHEELLHPFIHPSLEQPSLLVYLFKTVIFPGKRVTFLGNSFALPQEGPDEDWIRAMDVSLTS